MRKIYIVDSGEAESGRRSELREMGEGRAACFLGVGANQSFCQSANSGALIFTNEGHPVALNVGGSRNGRRI